MRRTEILVISYRRTTVIEGAEEMPVRKARSENSAGDSDAKFLVESTLAQKLSEPKALAAWVKLINKLFRR